MNRYDLNFLTIFQHVIEFARVKHDKQLRKYTKLPYVTHCLNVAQMIYKIDCNYDLVNAAILHDTVEDTDTTIEEIVSIFNPNVARLVNGLTDVSVEFDGNRVARKAIDREHIFKQEADVHFIKCADIIDNTIDIVDNDPNFARVYLKEMDLLVAGLKENPLLKLARETVNDGLFKIFVDKSF